MNFSSLLSLKNYNIQKIRKINLKKQRSVKLIKLMKCQGNNKKKYQSKTD